MAKIVSSTALAPLNKALGLAGSGDSQTELQDGILDQVLDVGPIARRGGSVSTSEGIFRVTLRNVHAGAGVLDTSWQPYTPAAAGRAAPYPTVVPDTLDFYLLGVSIERVSGGGALNDAAVRVTNLLLGFGIDNSGAGVVPTSVLTVAAYNGLNTAVTPVYGLLDSKQPFQKPMIRIPRRGAVASPFIVFNSDSSGIATFDCVMLVGLFPIALGQDAAF